MSTALTPRRILLLLDASPEGRACATATAELAAAFEAEVEGLFVEDAEALALARHPASRQLDVLTGRLRAPDGSEFERRLRVQAQRMRRALSAAARPHGVPWSFRVERGSAIDRLREAVAGADMITIRRGTGALGGDTTLEGAVASLLSTGIAQLFIHGQGRLHAPVVVAYDGSEEARAALALAGPIALRRRVRVEILLPDASDVERGPILATIAEQLKPRIDFEVLPLRGPDLADASVGWTELHPCSLLILPSAPGADHPGLASAAARVRCPVLLVERPGERPGHP